MNTQPHTHSPTPTHTHHDTHTHTHTHTHSPLFFLSLSLPLLDVLCSFLIIVLYFCSSLYSSLYVVNLFESFRILFDPFILSLPLYLPLSKYLYIFFSLFVAFSILCLKLNLLEKIPSLLYGNQIHFLKRLPKHKLGVHSFNFCR